MLVDHVKITLKDHVIFQLPTMRNGSNWGGEGEVWSSNYSFELQVIFLNLLLYKSFSLAIQVESNSIEF